MTAAIIRRRWKKRWTRSAALRRFASASALRATMAASRPRARLLRRRHRRRTVRERAGPHRVPRARFTSLPAPVRRDRAWRRSLRRSSPMPGSVHPDDVVIALADTAAIAIGFGTIASRTTVTLSAAIHGASEKLRTKVFAIAANLSGMRARPTSNCATATSASSACRARKSRLPRWRRRRGRAGITAGRPGSMPVSRRLITSSRRR